MRCLQGKKVLPGSCAKAKEVLLDTPAILKQTF
jgi:hypothetical protein